MILCADVGATKTLLGLAEPDGAGGIRWLASQRYVAAQVSSMAAMLTDFLQAQQGRMQRPLQAACLGVAGPVRDGVIQMTNLPWRFQADDISHLLGGIPVRLVNDFEAAAQGIDVLGADQRMSLQPGVPQEGGRQLVIGAGTGLGVAWRVWQGDHYQVVAGEGGHVGFSPLNEVQDRCMARLRPLVSRVVAEHFVSGPGLVNWYTCLGDGPVTRVATAQDVGGVTAEEIFRLATEVGDARALQAMEQFLLAYGAVAGDHALATLAHGGVFLAGGIAPKWGTWMQDGRFMRAFCHKGPYAELMRSLPVNVVMQGDLGLRGAAVLGMKLAQA